MLIPGWVLIPRFSCLVLNTRFILLFYYFYFPQFSFEFCAASNLVSEHHCFASIYVLSPFKEGYLKLNTILNNRKQNSLQVTFHPFFFIILVFFFLHGVFHLSKNEFSKEQAVHISFWQFM